jgi:uridine phosphorylase
MPARLRPTAPLAPDAILVGDPGRAMLLAQELLVKPKMSNHARGLWGYSGRTEAGDALTIQATGMGGPSAALVLGDLAELGVKRAIRIGTCAALGPDVHAGELLVARAALATVGSAASFGLSPGETAPPDEALRQRLEARLGSSARPAVVASLDAWPAAAGTAAGGSAADMQTLAVLAQARVLGLAAAAVLIVCEGKGEEALAPGRLEELAIASGRAASEALSNPQVEG